MRPQQTEVGRIRAKGAQDWGQIRQTSVNDGPEWAKFGPNSFDVGPKSAKFYHIRLGIDQIWLEFGQSRPNLARLDQIWPKIRIAFDFDPLAPEFSVIWPEFDQS